MYWNALKEYILTEKTGLIVTWDVLKQEKDRPWFCVWRINSNMRCIETWLQFGYCELWHTINSNMRCIETELRTVVSEAKNWLIVTWDVLKLCKNLK